jgi:hypothetical protein
MATNTWLTREGRSSARASRVAAVILRKSSREYQARRFVRTRFNTTRWEAVAENEFPNASGTKGSLCNLPLAAVDHLKAGEKLNIGRFVKNRNQTPCHSLTVLLTVLLAAMSVACRASVGNQT